MRIEGILRGDTDAPTTFSDLQHGATINLAQISIQDELNELTSDTLLPYEKKTTGSIVTVRGLEAMPWLRTSFGFSVKQCYTTRHRISRCFSTLVVRML